MVALADNLLVALAVAGPPTASFRTDGRLALKEEGSIGVIAVEPAGIVAAEPRGLNRLYGVLTRAVSRLDVLHTRLLPTAFR